MKYRIYFLAIFITFAASGCFQEESPVSPYDRGDSRLVYFDKSNIYTNQVYFSLQSGEIVKENRYDIWDIAFECRDDGYHVILNSAKIMGAANLGQVDFSHKAIPDSADWKWDSPTGVLDTTAIGDWREGDSPHGGADSKGDLFLIDLGYKDNGRHAGYAKLRINSLISGSYSIEYSDEAGEEVSSAKITKNPEKNFIMFSFKNGGEVFDLEPPKQDWDLLFTRYTHRYYDIPGYPVYGVNGVLLNMGSGVVAAEMDTLMKYSDITIEHTENLELSHHKDAIGFNWKYFDLDLSSYIVIDRRIYIIQDRMRFTYKLHFIDFYDEEGIKGFPKFEYKLL